MTLSLLDNDKSGALAVDDIRLLGKAQFPVN